MRIFLDCVPCFVKQTLEACRMATSDEEVHEKVLRAVLAKTTDISFDHSPPHMGREIHRIIREKSGNDDPYRDIKMHFNQLGLELLPELSKRMKASADPFETAVRLAIAGNIIDFGLTSELDDDRVYETIEDTLQRPLAINHLSEFRAAIDQSSKILYIGDNAGEIAFDRLLVEQLPADKVTFVVKGRPVINDATMEDARAVGLTDIVEVIDNGSDAPGTILETCSLGFRRRFEHSDLAIAKGQGNYETLNDIERNIFFLLKAKCPVISTDLGCEVGSIVVKGAKIEH